MIYFINFTYKLYKHLFGEDNFKNIKNFDENVKIEYSINYVYFYKKDNIKDKLIKTRMYENIQFKDNKYDIITNLDYDYFIMDYSYINNSYKLICEKGITESNNYLVYHTEQIKNYVYINKITNAFVFIDDFETDKKIKIDILSELLPYLGPNYNFYEDLNYKITVKQILKIILDENILLKIENGPDGPHLYLYDNFSNEYKYSINDYLTWCPVLNKF